MKGVKVYKVRSSAKLPHRAHHTDAGMDFFFCPEEPTLLGIEPGESVLLPTGIKMEVPEGWEKVENDLNDGVSSVNAPWIEPIFLAIKRED